MRPIFMPDLPRADCRSSTARFDLLAQATTPTAARVARTCRRVMSLVGNVRTPSKGLTPALTSARRFSARHVQRVGSARADPGQVAEAENKPPPRSSARLALALDEVPNQETAPRV